MSVQTFSRRPPSATTPRDNSPAARSLSLLVVLTAQLMLLLDTSIVNVALPKMQASLGFSPTDLSWVLNAYTLAFGGLLLFGARVGDLLGRRRVFIAGMSTFTLASFAGGLVQNAGELVAARAAQGVGAALAAPAVLAVLTSTFPEGRERNRALGLFSAVSIGGASIGLVAGGMLTEWVSWRWVMFVNVPIGIAVVVSAAVILTKGSRETGRFDTAGAVTSTLAVTGLVQGFVHAAEAGWATPGTLVPFVAAAVLFVLFVRIERRATHPIVPLGLFADRARVLSHLGRLTLMAAMAGTFFFTTQFLQDVLDYSPIQAGLAYLPLTAALFVGSQLSARRFIERYGQRAVLVAGTLTSTIAITWISRLDASSSYLFLLVPFVLFGLGNGTAFVPLTAASLQGVEPRHAGAASGLVNVSQQVGGSLGLALLVTVFGAASHAAGPGHGQTAASVAQHAFVVGSTAALAMAALLLAVTVGVVALIRTKPAQSVAVVEPS